MTAILQALAAKLSEDDIRWTHDATQVYTKIGTHTIWNLAISSPHSAQPFSVYATVDGKEVHVGAYATLQAALRSLQPVIA
jgi:hypothetical protein